MPRTCTICTHPELEAINRALVDGTPNRRIAAHYTVSEQAVRRHKADHLPAHLVKAREAEEIAEADELLSQVRTLQARALTILDKAEGAGDLRAALGAIREARGNLELLAKLLGELDERPINVLISPEWIELRAVIVGALELHPEARGAVLSAIEGESDAGA